MQRKMVIPRTSLFGPFESNEDFLEGEKSVGTISPSLLEVNENLIQVDVSCCHIPAL